MELEIVTPEWAEPLLKPSRYKCVYGGRGSGKSHFFAELMIEEHLCTPSLSSVCLREIQKSIKMSVKRLLEIKIEQLNLFNYFEIQETCIKRKNGTGIIIFQGLQNHTSDSIKSLESFDRAWVEEAHTLSQRSINILRPTIRKPGSELWFSWNPEEETDPVDQLFRAKEPPPESIIINVNYDQNPWFPEELRKEMEYDKKRDFDNYLHVWEGQYKKISESRVFKNWTVEEFEAPPDAVFDYGADWGFAKDPTVLIRSFTVGRKLYVDYEAYRVGCEINDTPSLFMTVPDAEKWPIVADSSRPETISYLRNHGFPKIVPAVKGKDSIEEGITFLQSYDIIVHPRCTHTKNELTRYAYKIDPKTGKILPILEDDNNHVMDALRYAKESERRIKKQKTQHFSPIPIASKW